MTNNIPKYIQELLHKSQYEYDLCVNNENYSAGYTLRMFKATPYTYADTFRAQLERMKKWVDHAAGVECVHILDAPKETRHTYQSAVVTIYDPAMKHLEKHIMLDLKTK